MATQFITEDAAKLIRTLPFGKKHPIRILLEEMEPGQILRISRQDFAWKGKTPNLFCREISKRTKAKFKVRTEHGKTGWVVWRLV